MPRITLDVDERELATILAALQLWQLRAGLIGPPVASGLVRSLEEDVATNGDAFSVLSHKDVEALTTRLNAPARVSA